MNKFHKKCITIHFDQSHHIDITNLNNRFTERIQEFNKLFVGFLDYEFTKFNTFLELKVIDTFRLWRLIKLNTQIYN